MLRLLYILLGAVVMAGCSGNSEKQYRQTEGATWGTFYHITYNADKDLSDSIMGVMHDIDMSLSPFQKESVISHINRGENMAADSMVASVLALSQRVSALSGGAFDPTVAPLINLWGFGYGEAADGDGPSQARIDSCLQWVGVGECHIDAEGIMVKKHPKTEFNFSAVAKGYGVDKVAEMLRRNGCTDYMVEIGGEIALSGVSPRGGNWVIQVDAPVYDAEGAIHNELVCLSTTGAGIATSGDYRNFRDTGNGRVSHTINAFTGRPVATGTVSATVVAPSTALADALATAVMAMHPDSALAMIEKTDSTEALIVIGHDSPKARATSGFNKLIYKKTR